MSIRIGAVSYLNTKPLIYGLRDRLPQCELRLDLPSRLADQLSHGQLDVALIPSVEYLRTPGLRIISNACIACRGPVRSVRLLLRKPASQVRTLALDEGSRTSAVLAQVLLARRFGIRPRIEALPMQAALGNVEADALLVIGDRAMKLEGRQYVDNWDLGQEWVRETGLPFVFAMWVSHAEPLPAELEIALQASRDMGLKRAEEIAVSEAIRYGLTVEDCLNYFLKQLHFELGPTEQQGLELFRQWASELALLTDNCQHLSVEQT